MLAVERGYVGEARDQEVKAVRVRTSGRRMARRGSKYPFGKGRRKAPKSECKRPVRIFREPEVVKSGSKTLRVKQKQRQRLRKGGRMCAFAGSGPRPLSTTTA